MHAAVPMTVLPPLLLLTTRAEVRDAVSLAVEPAGFSVQAIVPAAAAAVPPRGCGYGAILIDPTCPVHEIQAALQGLQADDPGLPVLRLPAPGVSEPLGAAPSPAAYTYRAQGVFAVHGRPTSLDDLPQAIHRALEMRTLARTVEQAHHTRQAHDARFQAVVESTPDAIIIADAAGRVMSWNPAAAKMFGYPDDAILGQPLTRLMPARYRAAHEHGLARLAAGGEARVLGKTLDLHGLRADGREFPLELSLASWTTPAGRYFSGIMRDLTERKAAEEMVQESERRFRQVVENIQEVFWVTTPAKTEMLYVSPAYERVWERSCASLYADPSSWLDAIHPDDQQRVRDAAMTKQVTGDYHEEYRIIRPDGEVRWIEDRAFPVRDEAGRVYRITGLATCVTERKRAQAAVRQAYDTIEALLASLPEAILLVDAQQQVVYANPLAVQVFDGALADGPVGHWVGELLPFARDQWAAAVDALSHPLALAHAPDREQDVAGEVAVPPRDYAYRLFPLRRHGDLSQIGLVLWDITEQKQLQAQLLQAGKLASLGTLAAGIAHEIRSPMQGILGLAELLQQARDVSTVHAYAGEIVQYAHRVATIVKDLVVYARPDESNGEEAIDLSERLRAAITLLQRGPACWGIQVVTTVEPIPRLHGRQAELDQVFVNLIRNAVDAMAGSGTLTVAARQTTAGVTIRIADTGCGIPKAILPRIFDPFFTTKAPGQGTGLGLSIAYRLVTKYGGTLTVDSEEGQGTTVTVQFPIAEAPLGAQEVTDDTREANRDPRPVRPSPARG